MDQFVKQFQPNTPLQELKELEELLKNNYIDIKKIHTSNSVMKDKTQLEHTRQEIENLKKQIRQYEEEIDKLKSGQSMGSSYTAPQCCKLMTGFSLAKSDDFYVGASIENPANVFRYKTEDANVVSKLWKKIEE